MVCGVRIMVLADAGNNNQLAINRLYIILYIPSKLENGDLGNQGHGQAWSNIVETNVTLGGRVCNQYKITTVLFFPQFPLFYCLKHLYRKEQQFVQQHILRTEQDRFQLEFWG